MQEVDFSMRLQHSCRVSQRTAGTCNSSPACTPSCGRPNLLLRLNGSCELKFESIAHPLRSFSVLAASKTWRCNNLVARKCNARLALPIPQPASARTRLPKASRRQLSLTCPQSLTSSSWTAAVRNRDIQLHATAPDAPNVRGRTLGPTPPPEVFEEGPAHYPDTELDLDMFLGDPVDEDDEDTDQPQQEEPSSEVPQLPFELGEDFMEEIRKYLVEEEGLDAREEQKLDEEVFKMASNLCEMSIAEDDPELDKEIFEEMVEKMRPYAEAQIRYEKQQRSTDAEEEGAVPGVDMGDDEVVPEGWETAEGRVSDEQWDQLEDPADLNGWGTAQGMELPENVSREAIAQFLDWDKECHETREGPRGSMGYREDRGGLHPAIAAKMQGIKGWQLSTKVHPKLAELAGNIEALWRQMFPLDFIATKMDPRWRLVDSVDPNQVWGIDYGTEDPEPGDPRWPRLALENRFYQTEKFRCLHLEIGIRQDGFQVLHCVMWPRREYDLPIFGADVVAIGPDVTFAIADTTPVNDARQLPDTYVDAVSLLRAQFAEGMRKAELPDWGEGLFSEEVMSVRPDMPAEADLACMHITALCKTHILYSKFGDDIHPIKINEDDKEKLAEVDRNHRRYCDLQLQNDKTAAVLRRSFRYMGPPADTFVARYMTEVLFNHEFHYDVDEATKQQMRENRKDMGESMGMSTENLEKVQERLLDGVRAGFMEAEEQGLDGLGFSEDEDEGEQGDVQGTT